MAAAASDKDLTVNYATNQTAIGRVDPTGYLNLVVNCMDNFSHGLAIAGSFCVGTWPGMVTTMAIITHEIPHEIGDYAILIRSGFSRQQAIIAQLLTSAGGIVGASFGLLSSNSANDSLWILPFTAGGFLYIALVGLLPDMLKDESEVPWWTDCLCVLSGSALVATTQYTEGYGFN